jgi:hypothetical protein
MAWTFVTLQCSAKREDADHSMQSPLLLAIMLNNTLPQQSVAHASQSQRRIRLDHSA